MTKCLMGFFAPVTKFDSIITYDYVLIPRISARSKAKISYEKLEKQSCNIYAA